MNGQIDHASRIVLRTLQALPRRRPFDLSELINVWNNNQGPQGGFQIGPNEDISSLADAVISRLPIPDVNGVPVFTRFLGSYVCFQCNFTENDATVWNKPFDTIPIINVPHGNAPVSIGELLTTFIQAPIQINCALCQFRNRGTVRVIRGMFTILRINRLDDRGNVINNRFTEQRSGTVGEQYVGSLISLVSHIDQPNYQHYLSYHRLTGANEWYRNSDRQRVQRVPHHPFQSLVETVNLVLFKNP